MSPLQLMLLVCLATLPFHATAADDATGRWEFDETSGNALDASGNGFTGVPTSGVSRRSGHECKFGGCLYFDGTGQVNLPTHSQFVVNTGDFTWSFWVRTKSHDTARGLVSNRGGGTTDVMAMEVSGVADRPELHSEVRVTITASSHRLGRGWTHLAYVRQNQVLTLYVDGQVSATAAVGENFSRQQAFRFGNDPHVSNFLGYMDSIGFYRRALSPSEITHLQTHPSLDTAAPPTPPNTDDALARWDFEEATDRRITDGSGHGFHGAISPGVSRRSGAECKFGKCLYFDGDAVASIPTEHVLTMQRADFTWSFWVKYNGNKVNTAFISNRISGGSDVFSFEIHTTANRIEMHTAALIKATGGSKTITPGTWNHIAFVRRSDTVTIYVNNVVAGSGAVAESLSKVNDIQFGSDRPSVDGLNFEGWMDNVAYYNRALSTAEILQLQTLPALGPLPEAVLPAPTDDATGRWAFDDGTGGAAADTSASSFHGTLQDGVSWAPEKECVFGGCLYFDGTGRVALPSHSQFVVGTGDFAWSFWFNSRTEDAARAFISNRGSATSDVLAIVVGTTADRIEVPVQGHGVPYFKRYRGAKKGIKSVAPWRHAVVTRNAGELSIFVDGAFCGVFPVTQNLNRQSAFYIGFDPYASRFRGYMDSVAFYRRGLTHAEVLLLSTQATLADTTSRTVPTGDGSYSRYDFDETSGIVLKDGSGYGNHGSFNHGVQRASGSACRFGGCLYFDGTGAAMLSENGHLAPYQSDWTWSFWVKYNGNQVNKAFVSNRPHPNAGADVLSFEIHTTSNRIEIHTAAAIKVTGSSKTLTPGAWNHVAFVRSTDTVTIYVNNVVAGSGEFADSLTRVNQFSFGTDAQSVDGLNFVGWLDAVAFYERALTTADIAYLQNNAALGPLPSTSVPGPMTEDATALYGFNEEAGGNVVDASGNGLNGILQNGVHRRSDSECMYGGCIYFDGTGQVDLPSNPKFVVNTGDFSWSFWLNTRTHDTARAMVSNRGGGTTDVMVMEVSGVADRIEFHSEVRAAFTSTRLFERQWTHIAFVRRAGRLYHYVDGKPSGQADVGENFSRQNAFKIGYDPHVGRFVGYIDSVAFYRRALEPREVHHLSQFANLSTSVTSNVAFRHPNPADSLARWDFDESDGIRVKDGSGNGFHGAFNRGVSRRTGNECRFGGCLYFDGTGAVAVSTSPLLVTHRSDFTWSFWAKYNGNQINRAFISNRQPGGGADVFSLEMYTTANRIEIHTGNLIKATGGSKTLTPGVWNHVAFVRSGDTVTIYVNNVAAGSGAFAESMTRYSTIHFGQDAASVDGLNYVGWLDCISFYDRALSTHELGLLQNSPSLGPLKETSLPPEPATDDATGRWEFDDGAGALAADESANNFHGAVQPGAHWRPGGECAFNGCLYFDGSGQVDLPSNPQFVVGTGDFAWSFWVRTRSHDTARAFISNRGSGSTDVMAVEVSGVADRIEIHSQVRATTPSNRRFKRDWTHIVLTRRNGVMYSYQDGLESGFENVGENFNRQAAFKIGFDPFINRFVGYLDSVAFYRRSLSPAEIMTLSTFNHLGATTRANLNLPIGDGAIARWDFEEPSGARIQDRSGNGYHGGISPGVHRRSGAECRFGKCLYFDGTGSGLITEHPTLALWQSDWTWSFWVKYNGNQVNKAFISNRPHPNAGADVFSMEIHTTSNRAEIHTAAAMKVTGGSRTITPGVWNHVAYVRNGNTVTIYVNNVVAGSGGFADSLSRVSHIAIGSDRQSVDGLNFVGWMDSVALYTRALSTAEIAVLQNAEGLDTVTPVGNLGTFTDDATARYEFDEGSGASASDTKGDAFHGTLEGGVTWESNPDRCVFGGCLYFDGTGRVKLPSHPKFVVNTGDFTWSFWLRSKSHDTARAMVSNRGSGTTDVMTMEVSGVADRMEFHSEVRAALTANRLFTYSDWTHIAFTRENGLLVVYINGRSSGQTAVGENFSRQQSFYLGYDPHVRNFIGWMDSVAFYRRAMTPAEVQHLAHFRQLDSHVARNHFSGDGATARWEFDETSGDSVLDSTSSGLTGTIEASGVTRASGANCRFGGCLHFDGESGIVRIPASNHMTPHKHAYTYSFWIKPQGNMLRRGVLSNRLGASTDVLSLEFHTTTNRLEFHTGANIKATGGSKTVTPNVWNHIAIVRTVNAVTIYVNNVVAGAGSVEESFSAKNDFLVGWDTADGGLARFTGYMDSLAYYERALTTSEILNLQTSTVAGTAAPQTPMPTWAPEAPPTPPTPSPDTCVDACLWTRCGTSGTEHTVVVTGVASDRLWGTVHFTDDSVVGAAAVHSGLLAVGQSGAVVVRCGGSQSSFVGSERNGITSQSYNEPWVSFSFPADTANTLAPGETPQPPTLPPAPETCGNNGYCLHNQCAIQGSTQTLVVTGSTNGVVYGSDTYTDDSHAGAAAVHKGVLQPGQTGAVTFRCAGPHDSYVGVERNGVTTLSYGFWGYSFQIDETVTYTPAPAPPADSCTTCMLNACANTGDTFQITVTGTSGVKIWGTDTYSDDSHVGVAAVHAGLVQVGATAELVATCEGPQQSFAGTIRNQIVSTSYGAWIRSYSLATSGSPPAATVCIGACVVNRCTVTGSTQRVIVTGANNNGHIGWGTDQYTDDSSVQLAAVHMGLVAVGEQAELILRCAGPADSWAGTTRHGVTTEAYGNHWGFSFTLSAP